MNTPRHLPRNGGLTFALLLAAGSGTAQGTDVPTAVATSMRFAAGELSQERVVKGAPYCADAVHESVQWLPDAAGGPPNRIVRQDTSRLCRDGEGRTRQELSKGSRPTVYLRDPVSNEAWVLDSERKTARKLGERTRFEWSGSGRIDESGWREYAEQMRQWARDIAERARSQAGLLSPPTPPTPPVPPTPPSPLTAPTPPTPPVPPTPVVIDRDTQIRVLRLDGERTVHETAAVPPAVHWRSLSMAPRGPGSVTALPPRDIEGQRANGERTTWTIEAGKLGNERPIQIVREVWTSPELMVTLATRDFDPRSPEQNYRLKNIKRGEPDPALFKVPADYAKPASRQSERRERAPEK